MKFLVSCVEFVGFYRNVLVDSHMRSRTCILSPPVIVDAGDDINNPPDLYGWSVWLWHGETDPGGGIVP